ncbi:MAG: 3-dehydroquinate dehydratase [Crocinitomicaceae bacterium]|nr:3-dehydroquinate dehydratase [Crocinitomicaceae bacterium]
MKIAIVNGPNLNLLGTREPEVYGNQSFEGFFNELTTDFPDELCYFQSNIEGELIDFLQQFKGDGILFNAGGYTHTSVAIRDCIVAIKTPVIEVHISNVASRESFRHESLLTPVCIGLVMGFGLESYRMALSFFTTD